MGFRCGIVGLPNVGKSTLFNALTATQAAEAANYPFCTIEPNIGRVSVPDERLDTLAGLAGSAKIIPTQIEFVDIAGLVAGASKGEGLGNQFLSHIREVDAIAHVVRCFEDDDITHVSGSIDPLRDIEIIETELMLADLDSVERRLPAMQKKAKSGEKEAIAEAAVLEIALAALREGRPARLAAVPADQAQNFKRLQLITAKPIMYVCNVEEASAATGNKFSTLVEDYAAKNGAVCVTISAAIEAEVAQLADPAEKKDYLATMGLDRPGLLRVIESGYRLLNLLTFFTVGPKEARAWTVSRGAKAPESAGAIHTDFEKGFIRAETIAYDDYVACQGETGAREAGKLRLEGKDYQTRDGDVFHFRFNV